MRTIALSVAVAAVLFLVTGGRLILIPLLFLPLGLVSLRRGKQYLATIRPRLHDLRRPG